MHLQVLATTLIPLKVTQILPMIPLNQTLIVMTQIMKTVILMALMMIILVHLVKLVTLVTLIKWTKPLLMLQL